MFNFLGLFFFSWSCYFTFEWISILHLNWGFFVSPQVCRVWLHMLVSMRLGHLRKENMYLFQQLLVQLASLLDSSQSWRVVMWLEVLGAKKRYSTQSLLFEMCRIVSSFILYTICYNNSDSFLILWFFISFFVILWIEESILQMNSYFFFCIRLIYWRISLGLMKLSITKKSMTWTQLWKGN